ncbi:MAG: type II toxin-antitoxin system RelE/ParE family toxin [Gemmatimonadota bacterium]
MELTPSDLSRAAAVDCIAVDRPTVAVQWFDGLVERVELLKNAPELGQVVPAWHEESVREIQYEPYPVVYEIFDDRIEIVTLSHMRQLLEP